MSKTYTIPAKMSGTGSIHDIASEHFDRDIVFAPGCEWAVVCASYYGGKGYTTHRTEEATIKAAHDLGDYSYQIIDTDGSVYAINGGRLCRI
jgi:hypothetical protein